MRVKEGETTIAEYEYDALGRRVRKTVGDTTTGYIYDGQNLLEEYVYDSGWILDGAYVHGPGIDNILILERDSSTWYYLHDGLGSVTDLLDEDGALSQAYEYDAWGNATIYDEDHASGNTYMYTGREWDAEIGLYYYRARHYAPGLGRFIQPDPIAYADGPNLYGYVMNTPTSFIDPMGTETITIDCRGQTYGQNCPELIECLESMLSLMESTINDLEIMNEALENTNHFVEEIDKAYRTLVTSNSNRSLARLMWDGPAKMDYAKIFLLRYLGERAIKAFERYSMRKLQVIIHLRYLKNAAINGVKVGGRLTTTTVAAKTLVAAISRLAMVTAAVHVYAEGRVSISYMNMTASVLEDLAPIRIALDQTRLGNKRYKRDLDDMKKTGETLRDFFSELPWGVGEQERCDMFTEQCAAIKEHLEPFVRFIKNEWLPAAGFANEVVLEAARGKLELLPVVAR